MSVFAYGLREAALRVRVLAYGLSEIAFRVCLSAACLGPVAFRVRLRASRSVRPPSACAWAPFAVV